MSLSHFIEVPRYPLDYEGTLLTRCRQMMRTMPLDDVAILTGLPYYWLKKLRAGEMKNPSVNRVQWLYEKLNDDKPLLSS